jgi:hypothetical protein
MQKRARWFVLEDWNLFLAVMRFVAPNIRNWCCSDSMAELSSETKAFKYDINPSSGHAWLVPTTATLVPHERTSMRLISPSFARMRKCGGSLRMSCAGCEAWSRTILDAGANASLFDAVAVPLVVNSQRSLHWDHREQFLVPLGPNVRISCTEDKYRPP